LHVVVAVDEDGRGILAVRPQLADHQRSAARRLDEIAFAADGADTPERPLGRLAQGGLVARAGRDRRDPQPVGRLVDQRVEIVRRDHLMTASVSPAVTAAPSEIGSSSTLPALWAVISFSIFIASMMQIRAPSSTCAPCSTSTLKTLPWSGEASVSPPPP